MLQASSITNLIKNIILSQENTVVAKTNLIHENIQTHENDSLLSICFQIKLIVL